MTNEGLTWAEIKDDVVARTTTRVDTWREQSIVLLKDGRVLSSGDIRLYERSILHTPEYRYKPLESRPGCYRAFRALVDSTRNYLHKLEKIQNAMTTKMRMWTVTEDNCLEGVVPIWYRNPDHCVRHAGGEKTIKTSRITDSHVTDEGKTVVVTENGSCFELTGPSRNILIAEANYRG